MGRRRCAVHAASKPVTPSTLALPLTCPHRLRSFHAGYLSVNFSSNYFLLSQRHPDVPRLTPAHLEASRPGLASLPACSVCVVVPVWGIQAHARSTCQPTHSRHLPSFLNTLNTLKTPAGHQGVRGGGILPRPAPRLGAAPRRRAAAVQPHRAAQPPGVRGRPAGAAGRVGGWMRGRAAAVGQGLRAERRAGLRPRIVLLPPASPPTPHPHPSPLPPPPAGPVQAAAPAAPVGVPS